MMLPNLNLYLDRPHSSLDLNEVHSFLNSKGLKLQIKGDFFESNKVDLDEVSQVLAGLRIRDINKDNSLDKRYGKKDVLIEKRILL